MDNKIYNYPIASILNQLGCRRGFRDMYFSPFGEETKPSLHVDQNKNLWFDPGRVRDMSYGIKINGTVVYVPGTEVQ